MPLVIGKKLGNYILQLPIAIPPKICSPLLGGKTTYFVALLMAQSLERLSPILRTLCAAALRPLKKKLQITKSIYISQKINLVYSLVFDLKFPFQRVN